MTALASVVAVFAVALLEAIFLGNGPRIARADATVLVSLWLWHLDLLMRLCLRGRRYRRHFDGGGSLFPAGKLRARYPCLEEPSVLSEAK